MTAAQAHKASDSYLRLQVDGEVIQGQWDIALRDLQSVLLLDANGDSAINWGELRARHADIADYALSHLTLHNGAKPCVINAEQQLVNKHADGAYTVLVFNARCSETVAKLDISYTLLFHLDRQHRGLLQLQRDEKTLSAVFSTDQPQQSFTLAESNVWQQFTTYLREGIWHLVTGYDHILFLIALLLPVVLHREPTRWRPVTQLHIVLIETFKIVTAFTLAHSLTLTLATTGTFTLPSRWVESAIAASVLLAALDNLIPLFRCPRWWVALCFGLLHGFGFATVLGELGLQSTSLVLLLFAFNLGVETGQLLIVASLLPLLYVLRESRLYQPVVLVGGSLLIIGLASLWLVERVADISKYT